MATINFSFQNFQYIMCSLDRLIEEHGLKHTHRNRYYKTIIRMCAEHVIESQAGVRGKNKSKIVLTEKGHEVASNHYAEVSRRNTRCLGFLYCFYAAHGDGYRNLKIGKSVNWRRRLKQYPGPAKPTEVLGTLHVRDMDTAEQKMLTRFRRWFDQFDREWFKIPHGLDEKIVIELFFQPLQDKSEG